MKKLVVICGVLLLAGAADAQRSGYKPAARKGQTSKYKTSGKYKSSAKSEPGTKGSGGARRGGPEAGRKFNISLGLSLATSNTVTKTYSDANGAGVLSKSATAIGVFVYPKFHVYSAEKFSISVGIPLSLGGSGSASANSRYGTESSFSFMYDLPLMVDFNGGCMSPMGRYAESKFGYFVGVGFGMQNANATNYTWAGTGTYYFEDNLKVKSVGPAIHAGGVLRVGNESRPKFIGFRIAYKIGLNADGHNYLRPSVYLNI